MGFGKFLREVERVGKSAKVDGEDPKRYFHENYFTDSSLSKMYIYSFVHIIFNKSYESVQ